MPIECVECDKPRSTGAGQNLYCRSAYFRGTGQPRPTLSHSAGAPKRGWAVLSLRLRRRRVMSDLEIQEWEVWHTYATYLRVSKIDLDLLGRRLVESGVALCSMLRDGRTYWNSGSSVGSGSTRVDLDTYASRATLNLKRDPGCNAGPNGFAAEAWFQAGNFRFFEQRLFGRDRPLPPAYLRAFLGQCNLIPEGDPRSVIRMYPILMVYEPGVALLELRTIGPESPTSLSDFISGALNLFQHPFDRVEVPPGLSRLATRAYYHSYRKWTLPYRTALIWLERGHDSAVRQLTRFQGEGDFSFDLAPLSGEKGRSERLNDFALTVFHTVAFVLGRPRSGVGFLLRGQRHTPELGGFWSGRPHIHVIRFKGQCRTASENENRYRDAFNSILLRVAMPRAGAVKSPPLKDLRSFDDYNAYVTSAASLWVWSNLGRQNQEPLADPNRGHLIYEHQAVMELMEYGYMLHRSLLDRAEGYADLDDVFAARRALVKLRQDMSEASYFGEIRELLEHGWAELQLPELRQSIQEALSLRKAETRVSEGRLTARVGRALTVVFGLVAVPGLAQRVVQPLWKLLGVPRPANEAGFETIANAVSLVGVGLIVALLLNRVGFLKGYASGSEPRRR